MELLHTVFLKNKEKIFTPVVKEGFIAAGTVMVAKEWEKHLPFRIDFNDLSMFDKVTK